jgi:hypothetical protein
MRTNQHAAFTVFDTYDTLYGGNKRNVGTGSGRRRRYLDWYGFRFSTTSWNVSVIELRDAVVYAVVQTVMEFERNGWVEVA